MVTSAVLTVALSVGGSAADAEEGVDGTVGPGDLVLVDVGWRYPYSENCSDSSPGVDPRAWYEDRDGVLMAGSEFQPTVSYRRTSAMVGFYVRDDVLDGYVALDVDVLYDCNDGTVIRERFRSWRWKIEGEPVETELPAAGAVGALIFPAVGFGSLWFAQRRSARRTSRA